MLCARNELKFFDNMLCEFEIDSNTMYDDQRNQKLTLNVSSALIKIDSTLNR